MAERPRLNRRDGDILTKVDGQWIWLSPRETYVEHHAPYGLSDAGFARWWAERQATVAEAARAAEEVAALETRLGGRTSRAW